MPNFKLTKTDLWLQKSGIADIIPGIKIDDFLFDPCGYSMNGLLPGVSWRKFLMLMICGFHVAAVISEVLSSLEEL